MASPATTGSTPLSIRAAHRTTPSSTAIPRPRTPQPGEQQQRGEGCDGDADREHRNVVAVDDGDHDQRGEVVDHEHREQEDPHPIGNAAAQQGEQPERQGGVRGHRHPPAVRARLSGVDRQEQDNRDHHPDQAGGQRKDEPPPFPQIPKVELAPRLQPDDQEEQRHQAAVDPGLQVVVEADGTEPDRQLRAPHRAVGRLVDVHPDECGRDGRHQHTGAAGLGPQERPQRSGAIPRPRRTTTPPATQIQPPTLTGVSLRTDVAHWAVHPGGLRPTKTGRLRPARLAPRATRRRSGQPR